MIACATLQIFNDLKISYFIVNDEIFDPKGKIVFYGGGGNWVPYYNHARKFILRSYESAKKLVILPHTISGNEALLSRLGNNVEILCRERVSFDHVKRFASKARVMLSRDIAFYLNTRDVLSGEGKSLGEALFLEMVYLFKNCCGRMPPAISIGRFLMREAKLFGLSRKSGAGVLCCFREDVEKTSACFSNENIDVSRLLTYGKAQGIYHCSSALFASNQMLRFINRYGKIKTNRLHVAIAGALLGKSVDFYRNSYYKNEAVYRHSFEKQFPNVRWMESDGGLWQSNMAQQFHLGKHHAQI